MNDETFLEEGAECACFKASGKECAVSSLNREKGRAHGCAPYTKAFTPIFAHAHAVKVTVTSRQQLS
jgi:hypothetical protein